MAISRQIFFGGSNPANTIAATGAQSHSIFGQTSSENWTTSPYWRSCNFSISGVIKTVRIVLSSAMGAGQSLEFKIYDPGSGLSATSIGTFTEGETSKTFTPSYFITRGDSIELQVVPTGSPTGYSARWSFEFQPTEANLFTVGGGTGNALSDINGALEFNHLHSGENWGASVNDFDIVAPSAGTIQRLCIFLASPVESNTSYEFTIYKNGSSEASTSVTLGAGERYNETLSIGLSVVRGDRLSLSCTTTTTGTPGNKLASWSIAVTPENANESWVFGCNDNNLNNAGTVEYIAPTTSGSFAWSATETDHYRLAYSSVPFELRDFTVGLDGTPGAGATYTFKTRVDGADGNEVLTVSDSSVLETDNSNVDSFSADTDYLLTVSHQATAGTPTVRDATWGWVLYAPEIKNSNFFNVL